MPRTLVCIGDSITRGTVSVNYVKLLQYRFQQKGIDIQIVNAGINSAMCFHILHRINSIIKRNPDFITILIGTNDINNAMTPYNIIRAIILFGLFKNPSLTWYENSYSQLIKILHQRTHARIALLSIPPVGEKTHGYIFEKANLTTQLISKIASDTRCSYLPLFEQMIEFLRNNPSYTRFHYAHWQSLGFKAILNHFLLGKSWDEISIMNGFRLHTDYLHLNTAGALMVVDLIEKFVTGPK